MGLSGFITAVVLAGVVGSTGAPVDVISPQETTAANAASETWTIRRVTSAAVDDQPSIALDVSGRAHVAYRRYGASPGLFVTTSASGAWVTTLAVRGDFDQPSLAVGTDGVHHLAYVSGIVKGIFYATDRGGRWTTSHVTTAVDGAPSIAISATGVVQIAYVRSTAPSGVYLATRSGNAWATTRVSEVLSSGAPAIAVGTDGSVHIAFSGDGEGATGIWYTTDRSGWRATRVVPGTPEADAEAIDHPVIALDPAGRVHIAFSKLWVEDSGIHELVSNGTAWTESLAAGGPALLEGGLNYILPSIAIDRSGATRIAFQCLEGELDARACGVYMTTKGSAGWTVAQIGSAGLGPLAVGLAGHTNVVYDGGAGLIHRANTDGGWPASRLTVNALDACPAISVAGGRQVDISVDRTGAGAGARVLTGVDGRWSTAGIAALTGTDCPDLGVDAARHPHVAACTTEEPGGDLSPPELPCDVMYAVGGAAGWLRTRISANGDGKVALDLDRGGRAHLVFGSYATDQVLYATNASGRWVVETVATGTLIPSPDVAVDAAGTPHVAYARNSDSSAPSSVWYATRQGGRWVRTLLATNTTGLPRIGVDRNGHVSVVFSRQESSGGTIFIRSNATGRWTTSKVATGTAYGASALAVDGSGAAHIAFVGRPGIYQVTNSSGIWRTTRVTSDVSDFQPTLDVDAAGTVHLAFLRELVGIYYAHT